MTVKTSLVQVEIDSLTDASRVCGQPNTNPYQRDVPLTLIPSNSGCSFYIAIPEGFHALVSSFGKFVDIWKAGFHQVKPWVQVTTLVTQQYIVYDTPVKECPTLDNVMVEVDVSVVFHIKDNDTDVFNFVYNMGPNKLDEMLMAFQQETVRTMARQKKYSNIYDLMDTEELSLPEVADDEDAAGVIAAEQVIMPGMNPQAIQMSPLKKPHNDRSSPTEEKKANNTDDLNEQLENTKRSMNEKFEEFGVYVYSITITNVVLPSDFRNQMESATTFESKNRCAAAQQEYNLLVIKDNEKRAQAEQRLSEELKEMESKNQQRLAGEAKLTSLYAAGTDALVADIEEKMNSDIRIISTDSDLAVAKLEKARDLELAQINAETDAERVRLNTEIDAFVHHERANAKEKCASLNAETLKLQAEAEAIASSRLISKRDYEAKMAQLRILKNLALNEQVSVSGTNKDSVMAQIVASQNSAIALGLK